MVYLTRYCLDKFMEEPTSGPHQIFRRIDAELRQTAVPILEHSSGLGNDKEITYIFPYSSPLSTIQLSLQSIPWKIIMEIRHLQEDTPDFSPFSALKKIAKTYNLRELGSLETKLIK